MKAEQQESELLNEIFAKRALMSQKEFGREFGLGTGSMVWQYLHGHRSLSLKAGSRFARGLGVPIEQFSPRLALELRDVMVALGLEAAPDDGNQEYSRIPCVELVLRPGSKRFSVKPILPAASFIAFRRDWLASNEYRENNLLAIQSVDDGMKPTIFKTDLVVINTLDVDLVEGHTYAFNYEGKMLIRRAFRDVGVWWLNCDNPDKQLYLRKQFIDKHCYVVGRVIHRQSESI